MKSFRLILLAVLAVVLVFSGCKKPKTGNLEVKFQARFNGFNVALDTTTFTSNGKRYQFTALKFYLSHINLIGPGGSITTGKDVALINFLDPSSTTLTFKDLKGDFTGILFGCGLDSALNNTSPTHMDSVDPTNPLGATIANDMYWSMQKYRFQTFDGKWDDTSSTYSFLTRSFSYHVGGDGLYRTNLGVPFTVSINAGNTVTATVYLDLDRIWNGPQTLDITTESGTQTLPSDNPAIAQTFVDNFSQAFSGTH